MLFSREQEQLIQTAAALSFFFFFFFFLKRTSPQPFTGNSRRHIFNLLDRAKKSGALAAESKPWIYCAPLRVATFGTEDGWELVPNAVK